MLTAGRLFRVAVITAVAAMVSISSAADAGRKSNPIAVMACAPTGCTESTTLSVPAKGLGETMTDQIPASATQGSINLQPTSSTDQQDFDMLVSTLTEDNPGLIPTKLNQRSKRILTCVFVSYLPFTTNYPDKYLAVTGQIFQAMVLNACLQLALSFPSPPAAADGAGAASVGCARFDAAVTIQLTHSRSGYRGVMNSKAHRPSQRPAATISCRRSGRGLLLTIQPRVRGQKLRQVVGPNLGVAYTNPTNKSVTVRTTLKVN